MAGRKVYLKSGSATMRLWSRTSLFTRASASAKTNGEARMDFAAFTTRNDSPASRPTNTSPADRLANGHWSEPGASSFPGRGTDTAPCGGLVLHIGCFRQRPDHRLNVGGVVEAQHARPRPDPAPSGI